MASVNRVRREKWHHEQNKQRQSSQQINSQSGYQQSSSQRRQQSSQQGQQLQSQSRQDGEEESLEEECDNCGFQFHRFGRCPARNVMFYKCNKRGHYARCCDATSNEDGESSQGPRPRNVQFKEPVSISSAKVSTASAKMSLKSKSRMKSTAMQFTQSKESIQL